MTDRRTLVTGGAGFIGSHLVDALLARGDTDVVVLDDFSTGKRANLAHLAGHPRLRVVEGSITDEEAVAPAMDGCEMVYHLAAAIGVRYVIDDPLAGMRTNIRGTETVLEAADRQRARVLIASSSEVYGKGQPGARWAPFREDADSVIGPTSVTRWWYALAKALDEHLGFAYHRSRGLPVSVVRYFNIYGPRCDPGGYGVLARFVQQALEGRPLTVFGDGAQTRSFTYVEDAVRGTLAAGSLPAAVGEAFNVGSAHETSIANAAMFVRRLTGSASPIHHVGHEQVYGANFEDTPRRVPDVEKARRLLGFSAQVDLEEGLRRTIEWWAGHTDAHISRPSE